MPGLFWITDYGAVGDGTTDCTAAFVAAANALVANGGGTIVVPSGKFLITNKVEFFWASPAVDLDVIGFGACSQILIDTYSVNATYGLYFGNAGVVKIDSLQFLCNGSGFANHIDCTYAIYAAACRSLNITNCNFWGLQVPSSVVHIEGGTLSIRDSNFLGCVAGGAAVDMNIWEGTPTIDHCYFIDYGNLNGAFYSKTPFGGNVWIRINDSANGGTGPGTGGTSIGSTTSNSIAIKGCGFDEGACPSIQFNPSTGAVRYQGAYIENCDTYGGQGNVIYDLKQINKVSVVNCGFNTRSNASGYRVVQLTGCNESRLEHLRFVGQNTPTPGKAIIYADSTSGTVEISECMYDQIQSDAAQTVAVDGGVRSRLRVSDGAIVANTIVKPSSTTDGRVVQAATTDSLDVCSGVALDGAAGANAYVRVVEAQQAVSVKTDGTAVTRGNKLILSTTSAGRVKPGAGPPSVLATQSGAAVADTLIGVVWR